MNLPDVTEKIKNYKKKKKKYTFQGEGHGGRGGGLICNVNSNMTYSSLD